MDRFQKQTNDTKSSNFSTEKCIAIGPQKLCDYFNNNKINKKEPDTSRSIDRCHTGWSLDTGLQVSAGAPRLILRDVMNQS